MKNRFIMVKTLAYALEFGLSLAEYPKSDLHSHAGRGGNDHGIAAAQSPFVMKWLAENQIQLNICPTSNVMLNVAGDYQSHPIAELYRAGIPVTVNTDDLLIFNQSVSQEYQNLFVNGVLSGDELNDIRKQGLKQPEQ